MSTIDSKVVMVNSSYRDVGGTNEAFSITVPSTFFIKKPKAVRLVDCHIPVVMDNVSSSNSDIVFTDGGGTHTATVPSGTYTITTLLAAVGTAMTAASGVATYTATQNSGGYVVITASVGTFSIDFTQPNNMAQTLGFPSAATPVATSATGSFYPSLSSSGGFDNYFYILSNLVPGVDQGIIPLRGDTVPAPAPYGILFAIPFVVDPGYVNYVQGSEQDIITNIENSIFAEKDPTVPGTNTITFTLQYPYGTTVDLKGLPWSVRIRFDFEDYSGTNRFQTQ
jgi:hypothetical protein